ncbi:MAG TPA: DUF1326 domain-containing protein [Thermoplasmata archaeon]|nr:DUF1326 domain-containing protein [Thermoplasmata archaeon]
MTAWNLSGSYFEACNCDLACPCVFMSPPTTGECSLLVAWHIDRGKYGDVAVDGLNVALAVHSPGPMLKTKWDLALYLDERASPAQRDALGAIFGGQAGGEPAALGPFVGKVLGVRSVRIDFEADGRRRRMQIPSLAEMEIEALPGQGDREVTLGHVPFIAVPNQTTVVAKSKRLSLHDHHWNWELSDKNGFYSPFSFHGP